MTNDRYEIIDIEQYAKEGIKIPQAKHFRIRIDRDHYVLDVPEMTGRDLLILAGKTPPERFALYQKLCGGRSKKIELCEIADFRTPGVERFMTLPLDQTEGGKPAEAHPRLRQDFNLPEEDVQFLERLGLMWENVMEGNVQRVVIYGYQDIPDGYNQKIVDLHVRVDRTYPDTQIDMVYFSPALSRMDGRAIKAVSMLSFDGKSWQQWSRHRTAQNPWRIGVDNLETHITLVREWLAQELKKV